MWYETISSTEVFLFRACEGTVWCGVAEQRAVGWNMRQLVDTEEHQRKRAPVEEPWRPPLSVAQSTRGLSTRISETMGKSGTEQVNPGTR